jgi:hypothetical protein
MLLAEPLAGVAGASWLAGPNMAISSCRSTGDCITGASSFWSAGCISDTWRGVQAGSQMGW